MTAVPIEDLVANVERGAAWLAEHDSDPGGRFYLWWRMGQVATSPMPGQPEEVRARWAQWYRAYERWRSLYGELERRSEPDAARIIAAATGG